MPKRSMPESTRRAVALRAGAVPGETVGAPCHYCGTVGQIHWRRLFSGLPGSWVSFTGLELDHVLPVFHGGSGAPENVVLACGPCNRKKGKSLEWPGSK